MKILQNIHGRLIVFQVSGACIAALLLLGCETTMHNMNAATYGQMARDPRHSPERRRAYAAFSQFSASQAAHTSAREAAREGRSQFNVNVNQGTGTVSPQPSPARVNEEIFACNYWRDFNNNGKAELSEFSGRKSRFRKEEPIILVAYMHSVNRHDSFRYTIYSPSGTEIEEGSHSGSSAQGPGMAIVVGSLEPSENSLAPWLVEKGGFGHFRFILYRNGAYVGSAEFEIVQ